MTQEKEPHHSKRVSFHFGFPWPPHRDVGLEVQHHKIEDAAGNVLERWRTRRVFNDDYSEYNPYKPSLVRWFRRMIRRG